MAAMTTATLSCFHVAPRGVPRGISIGASAAVRSSPKPVGGRPGCVSLAKRVGGWGASTLLERRADSLVAHGRKGMLGQTLEGEEGMSKKKAKKKADKADARQGSDSMAGSLEPAFAGGASKAKGGNWLSVGNVKDDFKEKPIKALVLANGNFCLVKWEDQVFCTSCNSTAYQYPLIDGELFFGPAGPAIRTPLDGTEYDLTTGGKAVR